MHNLALRIHFKEFVGEKQTAVETGIEGAMLFNSASCNLNPAQCFIPQVPGLFLHTVEGFSFHL